MCFCDCFVQRRIAISSHQREMIPRCNEKMGNFELAQILPNGMLQCYLPRGTSLWPSVFYNGFAEGGADAACFAVMIPLTATPASDPATAIVSSDLGSQGAIVPDCDNKTGYFKLVQLLPKGLSQCFNPFGMPSSKPFFSNDSSATSRP
ncbi:hypothetical protein BV898_18977 [Hypsibius exemplaris]|uniref:Uncharacterized protein n=1 Tax=Hypsibius exemplaris TaxID=2072580 RepID=A0A9X6RP18_HYPEX|nr:hypothetical protein BV898_18977 [Hypsibius exemplaris]